MRVATRKQREVFDLFLLLVFKRALLVLTTPGFTVNSFIVAFAKAMFDGIVVERHTLVRAEIGPGRSEPLKSRHKRLGFLTGSLISWGISKRC